MKKAHLRLLLNDPSEPLRFRVQPEGEDYMIFEIERTNLVSAKEDVEDWAVKQLRKPLKESK